MAVLRPWSATVMMTVSELNLCASFPYGYLGHVGKGDRDNYPSPDRLFNALVAAAGTGSTSLDDDDAPHLSQESIVALTWLENHPPQRLRLPSVTKHNTIISFRDTGSMTWEKGQRTVRGFTTSAPYRLDSPVCWGWDEVPDDIAAHLRKLAQAITYLGSPRSYVMMSFEAFTPTHIADTESGLFDVADGLTLPTPAPGRLDGLERAYWQARESTERTTVGIQRLTETTRYYPRSGVGVDLVIYKPVAPSYGTQIPWTSALAFTTRRPLNMTERISVCETLRKTLLRYLPDDVSAVIHGHFTPGHAKPENGVSFQYVEGATHDPRLSDGALLIMLPRTLSEDEVDVIRQVAHQITTLRQGRSRLDVTPIGMVSLTSFWKPVAPGYQRLWEVIPGYLSELHHPPRSQPSWGLDDAVQVSVAYAMRSQFAPGANVVELRDAVADLGVVVEDAQQIRTRRIEMFTHKPMNTTSVQVPYDLLIDMGQAVSDEALLCIGQSRHIGGGQLYPYDVKD